MNRRDFLTSGAAGAVAFRQSPLKGATAVTRKEASDRIALGPRKVSCSRLAIGTGTNGSNKSSEQTRKLGVKGLADLLRFGYDNGITFWDTADQYGSHPHVREALTTVRRENVTILTKTHASTAAEMKADLERFRRELNTDFIDILLLHNMTDDDWPERKKGAMEALSQAQERGLIRTKGVSCHSLEALKASAASKWVEVDLARINPAGEQMDASPDAVLSVLRQMKFSGKGVIGMKVLGAGALRDRVEECLSYALARSSVIDCFTIGVESQGQLADLIRKIPTASVHS